MEWQPTPMFLTGESYGQRSLEGYRPQGHKRSDTTERLTQTHKLLRGSIFENVKGRKKLRRERHEFTSEQLHIFQVEVSLYYSGYLFHLQFFLLHISVCESFKS